MMLGAALTYRAAGVAGTGGRTTGLFTMVIGTKGWLIIGGADAATLAAFARLRARHLLPVDKIGILCVLLVLNGFGLLGSFIVDTKGCGPSPSFACLLNNNIGVLSFGAACIAAITLYANSRVNQAREYRSERRREINASRAITAALDETVHNLQHFAYEITDDCRFESFPAIATHATFALLASDIAAYCDPDILSRVRTMQLITSHNRAMVRAAAEADTLMRPIALMDDCGITTFSRAEWLARLGNGGQGEDSGLTSPLGVVRCDERIITHLVRLMMQISASHPAESAALIAKPQFRWLETFARELKAKQAWWYYPKSSDVNPAVAAKLRSDGLRLYCWINDRPIERVDAVAIRIAFRDLRHGHI